MLFFAVYVTMASSSARQVFQKQSELMQRSISRVFLDLLPILNFAHVHCVTKTMTIKMDLLTFFAKRYRRFFSVLFLEIFVKTADRCLRRQ